MNNLTVAKERLERMSECKRIIKSADSEMRKQRAIRDEAVLEYKADLEALERMSNVEHREMLKLHYDEEKTWEEIAGDVHYSPTYIYNNRRDALEEFQRALEDCKK